MSLGVLNMKKKSIKLILNSIISTLFTIGFCVNIDKNIPFRDSFNGNDIIYIIIFIVVMYFLNKLNNITEKRTKCISSIIAIIFSIIYILGYSLNVYNDLSNFMFSFDVFIKNILKFIYYFILFFTSLTLLFNYIKQQCFKDKKNRFFTDSKKSFFIVWCIIFIAWIPYLLMYFPGILTPDSISQLYQAHGLNEITNHHPIIHTFLIFIWTSIGVKFGSITAGVAFYSLFQMISMSAIFSYTIYYMAKKNINFYIRLISFVFFAFFPINGIYSVTMWKDILFAGIVLLFIIQTFELITQKEYLNNRKNLIVLIIISIGVALMRNNGYYAIILSYLSFIVFMKEHRKKLIVILLFVISSYSLYKGPLFSLLDIKPGSTREALSVPLQHIARVHKYNRDDLNQEEKTLITSLFNEIEIGDFYNPRLSDPVKNNFNDTYFENNKLFFLKTWIKMSFRFPMQLVESYLSNSFGYWYPDTTYWTVSTEMSENKLLEPNSLLPNLKSNIEKINIYSPRNIPILSMFYSIGFSFLIMLTAIFICIINRYYKMILLFLPILFIWLTVTASPVYAEYRYIYSMIISVPFLIGSSLYKFKENVKMKES